MKLQHVPLEWVPAVWPKVEDFLIAALEYAKGDYDIEHVRVLVSTGQWMLLVAVDGEKIHGAATMHCFNRAVDRVAFVTTTGGKFILDPDMISQLHDTARALGATALECAARESMTRLLGRLGFEEKYRIVGVKL